MTDEEQLMTTYSNVARHIMLQYMGRHSCITATRITTEVMKYFGYPTRVLTTRLVAECKDLKFAYISGFDDKTRAEMHKKVTNWVDLKDDNGEVGYNGHVIAVVNRKWWIDSSIDQIQSEPHGLVVKPSVLVLPLDTKIKLKDLHVHATVFVENNAQVNIQYMPHSDYSFYQMPAWEIDDAVLYVCNEIVHALIVMGCKRCRS